MAVTWKKISGLGALLALLCVSFGALAADEAEEKFRAKFFLEPTVALKFLDEKRSEIDLAEFSRRTNEGAKFAKWKTTGPKGEDIRTFVLLAPLTAEQLAKAKAGEQAHNAKMQQFIGKPLAGFKLLDVEGKSVSNQDLLGRPTLINFYFAECLPCIMETPMLNEYLGQRTDLRMLAVTFEDKAAIEKYNRKHKFTWRSLVDAQTFIDKTGVQAYPSFMLVDEKGLVKAVATASEFPSMANEFKYDSLQRKWLDDWVNRGLAATPTKQAAQ